MESLSFAYKSIMNSVFAVALISLHRRGRAREGEI
jgi:hypothetical protein